ncbi:acyl-homoserine-lactone synthase [Pseudoruegeria sp. SK021]|uniref:acyl-homoserine-lactone synthase n=1 Tax=Pseudoruegeria sp. SK021 TaxID=1933035 RepID=UPI000A24E510|nr:acyl-homoserine-lactone synthase [Pseudoruegeria sp. SK021]OSP56087.1 autoinducer synthase [Pseudoruegeria sp. SK021]
MIRYLFSNELAAMPRLHDSMFRDRADQFQTRLGWDVSVNDHGEERDAYDAMNPLYVIWQHDDGSHGGSMRFLPTTGRTMLNDHFRHILRGGQVCNPRIWECTRFCLSRRAAPKVSAALMLGGAEMGLGFNLRHSVGVFDHRMVRIYRRLGWSPTVLGSNGAGRDQITAGIWTFSEAIVEGLCRKADIPRAVSRLWFHQSRGPAEMPLALTA